MKFRNSLSHAKVVICVAAVVLGGYWTQSHPLALVQAHGEPKLSGTGLRGELIYVPIYSSIFYENGRSTIDLAATLSIHNVNPTGKLTLTRVDYHDTEGKLLKKYLAAPIVLNPLETKNFVVDKSDKSGGTGANFLVEWRSEDVVTSPIVEAVMLNAASNLGIAFTTTGKVVQTRGTPPN